LVEVVKGRGTSEETINLVVEICKKLGKVPIVCKDSPGFIVNT
jgi:3-hydroxyacyl-CoA dehydrogenase